MRKVSDLILEGNIDILGKMLNHPFVNAVLDGSLPADAYRRYLIYEGAFVETAISIYAYATAKAPDLAAKRWLIGIQDALAQDQMPYFEERFADLGIEPGTAIPEPVHAFGQGMVEIAQTGDFVEIVTAMFAAEWMYWTWCSRAAACDIADPCIRRWVELHADEDFAAQARWLKEAVDLHAAPEDHSRLSAVFGRVMELEIAFHHAPLTAGPEKTVA